MKLCSDCKEKERSWNFQSSICKCETKWCENYLEEIRNEVVEKRFVRKKDLRDYFYLDKIISRKIV